MPSPEPFRWRSIALPALLPTVLFSTGEGAIIPILPLVAQNLGADLPTAGLVASMILVGNLASDLPSGALIARVGERAAMVGAAALASVGLVVALVAPSPAVLAIGMLLVGMATTVFALARHAFLTTFVPLSHRARALSTLGGTFRFGNFAGPLLAALVVQLSGDARFVFWVPLACCVAAAAVLLLLPDPESVFGTRSFRGSSTGVLATIGRRRRDLVTVGTGAAIISALRAGRIVLLPLWAVSIGADGSTTALILGLAGAVDLAVFYLGGWIMDRFGRLWTAVPSALALSLGFLALVAGPGADARLGWFAAVAVWMAAANGIGSGTLLTIGADLADPADPAPFLAAWRLLTDIGSAAAPLAIASLTAIASLPAAALTVGSAGIVGTIWLALWVPRTPMQDAE